MVLGETLMAPALISRILAMMLFPYAGSSLTMCKTSNGNTSRVLTSLRKMSFGVALSTRSPTGSANDPRPTPSSQNLSKLIITRIISLRNHLGPYRVGARGGPREGGASDRRRHQFVRYRLLPARRVVHRGGAGDPGPGKGLRRRRGHPHHQRVLGEGGVPVRARAQGRRF